MANLTPCPEHPGMLLLPDLTCPICAQERRTAAYERQKAEMARQLEWAVQGLLKPKE